MNENGRERPDDPTHPVFRLIGLRSALKRSDSNSRDTYAHIYRLPPERIFFATRHRLALDSMPGQGEQA